MYYDPMTLLIGNFVDAHREMRWMDAEDLQATLEEFEEEAEEIWKRNTASHEARKPFQRDRRPRDSRRHDGSGRTCSTAR